jgi:tetratricopeptide (TPR) repeat protein
MVLISPLLPAAFFKYNNSDMRIFQHIPTIALIVITFLPGCKEKTASVFTDEIAAMKLKRGEVILCGPADKELGSVKFASSGEKEIQQQFNFATALLHSFEYDEAEKAYAKIIETNASYAMAYWGVAMSNFHPLWTAPEEPELQKGSKALRVASSIEDKTSREKDYIQALHAFYDQWETKDHYTRCQRYEKAMESLYKKYPDDIEAGIFYALAINAAADPADQTFTRQRKAGEILESIGLKYPDHPGVIHYVIHTYDSPGLAHLALKAARKYASIAPASAHAQHMPSHIFTRMGYWDESIQSNIASTESAKCYAETAGIKGHWDEELHGLDYLMYAYLQSGQQTRAKDLLAYYKTIKEVYPDNLKVAYSFASIPARFVLENKMWKDAAALVIDRPGFPWEKFPWQNAIIHFTRCLGAIHTNQTASARKEYETLQQLHRTLVSQKETYKANQVDIQVKSMRAWMLWKEGKNKEAIDTMTLAAEMEDKTQKHPVTPGEVLPARELLADLYLALNEPSKALAIYEQSLTTRPNRRNSIAGALKAAEASGQHQVAGKYKQQLVLLTESDRPLASAK